MATTSLRSPADLCNNALVRCGYKMRVGNLFDGSEAAQNMLDLYGQARDVLLREFDYDFAYATINLTLLKSAPTFYPPTPWDPATNPPPGFLFEYDYPDAALKVRSLKQQPLFAINPDPSFYAFTDAYDGTQRVILTNCPNAIAAFTKRVTDPEEWDVAFTEALATRLAALAGPGLVGLQASQLTIPEGQQAVMQSTLEGR